jgi:hypothetical protein
VLPFVGIWGKVKIVLAGLLAMLLPILYILGRRDGSKLEQREALKEAVETEHERADFYKAMEQESNEIESDAPRNRDDLSKRLREHGL